MYSYLNEVCEHYHYCVTLRSKQKVEFGPYAIAAVFVSVV